MSKRSATVQSVDWKTAVMVQFVVHLRRLRCLEPAEVLRILETATAHSLEHPLHLTCDRFDIPGYATGLSGVQVIAIQVAALWRLANERASQCPELVKDWPDVPALASGSGALAPLVTAAIKKEEMIRILLADGEEYDRSEIVPIPAYCPDCKYDWVGKDAIRAPSLDNCWCFYCSTRHNKGKLIPHPNYTPVIDAKTRRQMNREEALRAEQVTVIRNGQAEMSLL